MNIIREKIQEKDLYSINNITTIIIEDSHITITLNLTNHSNIRKPNSKKNKLKKVNINEYTTNIKSIIIHPCCYNYRY